MLLRARYGNQPIRIAHAYLFTLTPNNTSTYLVPYPARDACDISVLIAYLSSYPRCLHREIPGVSRSCNLH